MTKKLIQNVIKSFDSCLVVVPSGIVAKKSRYFTPVIGSANESIPDSPHAMAVFCEFFPADQGRLFL